MAELDIDDVRQAIAQHGARWLAGETGIRARRGEGNAFGLSVDEPQRLTLMLEAQQFVHAPMPPPPSEVDWRQGGWVTPVQDQKTCGACVAFSTVGALEARVRIAQNDASFDIELSEAQLFFCGPGASCDGGWTVNAAMAFCQNTGLGDRASFPYTPADQVCRPLTALVRVTTFGQPVPARARKTAVAKGPVIACMKVFDDFTYYTGGIYSYTSGAEAGRHAVCVVGYSDADQCWIVKNSWGEAWGEHGFFRVAYGQSIETDFPFYSPDVMLTGQAVAQGNS